MKQFNHKRIRSYSPGTEKLLKGTESGMIEFGITKAAIAIWFEDEPLPSPKKDVLDFGAERAVLGFEEEGGGKDGSEDFNPTPRMTLAK